MLSFTALKGYGHDIGFSFLQGARFDILVIIYFAVPLVLFALLSILWRTPFEKVGKVWTCFATILFVALLIGDFYYYRFFNAHYNMLIFGIVDDETQAVLKSIWTDFPVIRILLFLIALSIFICYIIGAIYRTTLLPRIVQKGIGKYVFILILPLIFLCMRGKLGMFPLRLEDSFFSKNQFINSLTQNGLFTFKAAFVDYKRNKLDISIDKMLAEAGFASDKDLVSQYLNIPINLIVDDPLTYLQTKTTADTFRYNHPPHVIVLQMEGIGLNIMDLQAADFQVLGSLANELPHCIVFKKFLPFAEGTIFSLEGLITSSVISPVSLTPYFDKQNIASAVIPFHNAGYEATFVTGAKKAWRNLDIYLPAQGFDSYESKENIMHDIPKTEEQEWGAYDGYMFQQIWNRINAAKSPQLIYGMSITNHTPFTLPSNYAVSNMKISPELKKRLIQNEELCYNGFSTYRYACDCLADFIRKVRNSPLSDKVIIAITGDHSMKGIIRSADNNLLEKYGVPLVLYVPECYLKGKTIDTTRWGAHKDIFPTMFNLALSNIGYYNLGNDLLTSDVIDDIAY